MLTAVDVQAKELQNVRNNFVCQRCSKETTTTPRVIASSQLKATGDCPWLSVSIPPQTKHIFASCQPLSANTVTRKIQSAVTPIQRVQSVAITQFRPLDAIVTHTQPVIFLSSPITRPQASDKLGAYPNPGPEESDWSIKFNKTKLDVEIVHTFFHGKPIGRVQFSQDGRYLAAGCYDGKAYIYDVETGTLTW